MIYATPSGPKGNSSAGDELNVLTRVSWVVSLVSRENFGNLLQDIVKNNKRLSYLQIDLNSRCAAFHTPESEMTTSKELVIFSDHFVFSQITEHLPWSVFDQRVTRYDGDKYVKAFTYSNQYQCMAFTKLTYRTSLSDIKTCLRTEATKLYHMGIRGGNSRTTLASVNQVRD